MMIECHQLGHNPGGGPETNDDGCLTSCNALDLWVSIPVWDSSPGLGLDL